MRLTKIEKEVVNLVETAGEFALNKTLLKNIKNKSDIDFVTGVDLKISNYLKKELKRICPEVGFMSEEDEECLDDVRWILDPIDGTTNLLFDYKLSSVSLALYRRGEIMFGCIYNPFSKEMIVAKKGMGVTLNGKKAGPIKNKPIKMCLIDFGAGVNYKDEANETFEIGKEVFKTFMDIRRNCSSALAISFIGLGRLDGYFERHIKPWDIAAASLVVTELGGRVCDFNGKTIAYDKETSFIAGSNEVCEELLRIINKKRISK